MIRIRTESDLRNWFKKNYKKLGFEKILKSSTKSFPDFVMLEEGKPINVELEIKTSNFLLHKHPMEGADKVICVEEDTPLKIPTIRLEGIKLIEWGEKESPYSIKKQVYNSFKNNKLLVTSEIASSLNLNRGTVERALLELTLDGKVERIKKQGVNLWLPK